ncbi:hypothetical protein GGQ84_000272 [Desulfitispora alkaliphila]
MDPGSSNSLDDNYENLKNATQFCPYGDKGQLRK